MTGTAANAEGIAGFDYDMLAQKPFRRNDLVDDDKENALDDVRTSSLKIGIFVTKIPHGNHEYLINHSW